MATAILADVNIQGHVERLIDVIESGEWAALWAEFGLALTTFRRLGLARDTSDRVIWRLCQSQQLLLLTANRNSDDLDSLEATIREEGTPESLPVFTLADADRIWDSSAYAERIMVRLMDYLSDLDDYRGTGRLFLP
jgi:hypothetical protein